MRGSIGEVFSEAYRRLESSFYSIVDRISSHGIPANRAVEFLEDRGIPAFPVAIALLLIIVGGILWGTGLVGEKTYVVTVYGPDGTPLGLAAVKVNGQTYYTDAEGRLELKGIEGPVKVEIPGYEDMWVNPAITQELKLSPLVKEVTVFVLDDKAATPAQGVKIRVYGDGDEKEFNGSTARFRISLTEADGTIKTDESGSVTVEVSGVSYGKKIVKINWNDSTDMKIEKKIYVKPLAETYARGNIVVHVKPSNVTGIAKVYRNGVKIKEKIFQNGLLELKDMQYDTYEIRFEVSIEGKIFWNKENKITVEHRKEETVAEITLKLPGYDGSGEKYDAPENVSIYSAKVIVVDEATKKPVKGAKLVDAATGDDLGLASDENGIIEVGFNEADVEVNVYVMHPDYEASETFTLSPGGEETVKLKSLPKTGTLKICAKEPWPDGSYQPVRGAYYRITAGKWEKTGNTGSDGCATVEKVPAGDVVLFVAYPSGEFPVEKNVNVEEDDVKRVDVELAKMVSASITVKRTEDGAPLSAEVRAVDTSGKVWAEGTTGIERGVSLKVPAYVRIKFIVVYGGGYRYETEEYILTESRNIEILVPTEVNGAKINVLGYYDEEGKKFFMVAPGKTYYIRLSVICNGTCDLPVEGDGVVKIEGTKSMNVSCNGICSRTVEVPFTVKSDEEFGVADVRIGDERIKIPYGYELSEEDVQGADAYGRIVAVKDGKEFRTTRLRPLMVYSFFVPFAVKFEYENPIVKIDTGDLQVVESPESMELANVGGYSIDIAFFKAYAPSNGKYTTVLNVEDTYELSFQLRFSDGPSLKDMSAEISPERVPRGCTGYELRYKLTDKEGKLVNAEIIQAEIEGNVTYLEGPEGTIYVPTTTETLEITFLATGYRETSVELQLEDVSVRGVGIADLKEPATEADGTVTYVINPDLGLELVTMPVEKEEKGYVIGIKGVSGREAPLHVKKTGEYSESAVTSIVLTQDANLVSGKSLCPTPVEVNVSLREIPENYCGILAASLSVDVFGSGRYAKLDDQETLAILKLHLNLDDASALIRAVENGRIDPNIRITLGDVVLEDGKRIPAGSGKFLDGSEMGEKTEFMGDVIKKYGDRDVTYYVKLDALKGICGESTGLRTTYITVKGTCGGKQVLDRTLAVNINCGILNDKFSNYVEFNEQGCTAEDKKVVVIARFKRINDLEGLKLVGNDKEYGCTAEGDGYVCKAAFEQSEAEQLKSGVEVTPVATVKYGDSRRELLGENIVLKCESIGCGELEGVVVELPDNFNLPGIRRVKDDGTETRFGEASEFAGYTVKDGGITVNDPNNNPCANAWCDPVLAARVLAGSKEISGNMKIVFGKKVSDEIKVEPKISVERIETNPSGPPPIYKITVDGKSFCTTEEFGKLFHQDNWPYEVDILPVVASGFEKRGIDTEIYGNDCKEIWVPGTVETAEVWFDTDSDNKLDATIFGRSLSDFYRLILAIAEGDDTNPESVGADRFPAVVGFGKEGLFAGEPVPGASGGKAAYVLGMGDMGEAILVAEKVFGEKGVSCGCYWHYDPVTPTIKPEDMKYLHVTPDGSFLYGNDVGECKIKKTTDLRGPPVELKGREEADTDKIDVEAPEWIPVINGKGMAIVKVEGDAENVLSIRLSNGNETASCNGSGSTYTCYVSSAGEYSIELTLKDGTVAEKGTIKAVGANLYVCYPAPEGGEQVCVDVSDQVGGLTQEGEGRIITPRTQTSVPVYSDDVNVVLKDGEKGYGSARVTVTEQGNNAEIKLDDYTLVVPLTLQPVATIKMNNADVFQVYVKSGEVQLEPVEGVSTDSWKKGSDKSNVFLIPGKMKILPAEIHEGLEVGTYIVLPNGRVITQDNQDDVEWVPGTATIKVSFKDQKNDSVAAYSGEVPVPDWAVIAKEDTVTVCSTERFTELKLKAVDGWWHPNNESYITLRDVPPPQEITVAADNKGNNECATVNINDYELVGNEKVKIAIPWWKGKYFGHDMEPALEFDVPGDKKGERPEIIGVKIGDSSYTVKCSDSECKLKIVQELTGYAHLYINAEGKSVQFNVTCGGITAEVKGDWVSGFCLHSCSNDASNDCPKSCDKFELIDGGVTGNNTRLSRIVITPNNSICVVDIEAT
ncbi:MAG: hypothetical protein PWP76_525 [Candidatus Diapherotrites archaeon]|nr:hypothetical protein [Candidatus Diapherotrites archaeon]